MIVSPPFDVLSILRHFQEAPKDLLLATLTMFAQASYEWRMEGIKNTKNLCGTSKAVEDEPPFKEILEASTARPQRGGKKDVLIFCIFCVSLELI